jgi:hypothetical protein
LVVHRTFFLIAIVLFFFFSFSANARWRRFFFSGTFALGEYRGSIAQWKCCKTCGSKHT